MVADHHVHTVCSDDSVYPMETVVQDALALGLDELCFTEWCTFDAMQPVFHPL